MIIFGCGKLGLLEPMNIYSLLVETVLFVHGM